MEKVWQGKIAYLDILGKRIERRQKMGIKKVLENNGFTVTRNGNCWFVSQYTPAGEDWCITFYPLSDVKIYAENYDPEEDFKMWINSGAKGVPSVPELWKDQLWKQEVLNKVLEELK